MANPIVFLDFTIGGKPVGRVEFELYADTCPLAAENFRAFCTGEKGIGKYGSPLHYKDSKIDMVCAKYGYMRGGNIFKQRYIGGESIYGGRFKGEFSGKKLDRPGMLSLESTGKGNVLGYFAITTQAIDDKIKDAAFLSSNHVIGHVVNGLDVLKAIQTTSVAEYDSPTKPVIIADCGQIVNGMVVDQNLKTEVYFDIQIGGVPSGRIIMKLFYDTTPRAAETFLALCTRGKLLTQKSGKYLHYRDTTFSHVIPGVMCHGGDFSPKYGFEHECIYGSGWYLNEKYSNKHTGPGNLSMVDKGNQASGWEFYICTTKTDWLDHKHVVFGQVVHGMDVVNAIENVGSADGTMTKSVKIADCGKINFVHGEETSADNDDIEPY